MDRPPDGADRLDVGAEMLRAIVEGTSDAVFVKDPQGRFVFCNGAGAAIMGRAVDQVLGHTDHDLFPTEIADQRGARDRAILDHGQPEMLEERIEVAGELRTFLVKKFPYRGADGNIVGVIGIARDVTQRDLDAKTAAEAAHQSERLLRLVLDALPVGVIVVDPRGDLMFGNPAAARIWGRTIEHGGDRWAMSRAWWHASNIPVQQDEWASVRALVEGVAHLEQLIDIEGFDGVRRTIRNSAVPIIRPKGIEGAVILNEDITEKLQLEVRLAQTHKMEAVGRLAGGVAHDFNNLLMVILSNAALMLETFEPSDPRCEDLSEIQKAADSATGLTRQLLAFGRRDVKQPRDVHIEAVIVETEKLLARVIGEDIRLVTHLADPPNVVRIDPLQLEQIIVNLAVNARDAMPSGGELAITTETFVRAEADAQALGLPPGLRVLVTVRDTGTGMDEPTCARIFEPFFTTKERGRGTGLGLATVYAIVEEAGGMIRVRSRPGAGTAFEIELPLSAGGAVLEPLGEGRPPARGSEAILLVEDATPVRVVVRAMLVKLGYAVHDVADVAAALAFVDGGGAVDLLLTDIVLSGPGGHELATALIARRPQARVVFMTGYALVAADADGQHGVLAKPFSAGALGRAVREALDGDRLTATP